MHPTCPRLFALVLSLSLPGALLAQDPGPGNEQEAALSPPVPVTWLPHSRDGDPQQLQKPLAARPQQLRHPGAFRSVGLQVDGDHIDGAGTDYKVTFDADRVLYTPALPPAPHNFPVDFRVQAFGRGGAAQTPSSAQLSRKGDTVLYTRPEFVESWELRPEGIKQSFTFDRLPQGDGDLVVRMQLQTELLPQIDGADAMSLNLAGIGGVSIKDVVGIDAAGVRIQGSLHYDAGVLELRLPDAAVDAAKLPLVLDPIVGTTLTVVASSYNTFDSDAAYDEAANLWIVVYARQFSTTDYDIHAQRINLDGTLNGGTVLIDNSGATIDTNGRVSTINSQNSFIVVWRRDNGTADDIYGRAVRASDAAMSTSTILVTSSDNLGQPDIGGEATASDNDGILVWTDFTTGEINAKQVAIVANRAPALPTITPFATVVLVGDATGYTNSSPAISETGGDTGNHCIVWMRQFTGTANTYVRAAIVSRNLAVLDSFLAVADAATGDHDNPDVDGNGRNWVVAWDREASSGSGDPGIYVRAIGWNSNATAPNQGYFVSGQVVVEDDLNDSEFTPAVAWTGDGVLVAYVDNATVGDDDIFANLIDLYTCALCRSTDYNIDITNDDADSPSIASCRSAGENNVRSLVSYRWNDITSPPTGSNADIRAIRFDADEGTISNLGGGCGTGGTAAASCAVSPNAAFTIRLRSAAPSGTNYLLLSPSTINLSCGACTLVPNPYAGFVSIGTNNSLGDRSVSLPIPAAVVGASLVMQFVTTGSNCFGGFDLSNAVRITVQ